MLDTGTIFILISGYWILVHGKAFGLANYCKRIWLEHAELLAKKERGKPLDSSELQLLRYIRLNDHFKKRFQVSPGVRRRTFKQKAAAEPA